MKTTTGMRIREALEMRGMKQIDLARATGLGRGAISQYMSDKVTPKQDKLYIMAKALLVSPTWLMGYDVPMEQEEITVNESFDASRLVLDAQAKAHVRAYLSLSKEDRAKVVEYTELLADKARDTGRDSQSSTAAEDKYA